MAAIDSTCGCGRTVPYNRTTCECGRFFGYPNVRRAQAMKAQLDAHYDHAKADALGHGLAAEVAALEALLTAAAATIAMEPKILRNISYGQPYKTYYQAVDDHDRQIAAQEHHADREAVDAKIHTGYSNFILNAALSADGRALNKYGEVTVVLKSSAIEDQTSLLRENAFVFYTRYDLGALGAHEDPGWRSTWEDRGRLGIATLTPSLTGGITPAELCTLVMQPGATKYDDQFLEVHIFGPISFQTIESVRLDRPLPTPQAISDWEVASQKLSAKAVSVLAGVTP